MGAGNNDLQVGQAVPRAPDPADEDAGLNPRARKRVVTLARKNAKWVKGVPQVVGHATDARYKNHRKNGPTITRVFDLLKPAEVKALNKLRAQEVYGADGGEGPGIYLVSQRQVVGDRWICLVEYCDIYYQQILLDAPHEPAKSSSRKKRKTEP